MTIKEAVEQLNRLSDQFGPETPVYLEIKDSGLEKLGGFLVMETFLVSENPQVIVATDLESYEAE